MKSLLVRTLGFPATLIHGDTLVLDRWLWLKKRLFPSNNSERLIDIGCGTGAFTIGAALKGYSAIGLSWDQRNQRVAQERACICKAKSAEFEVVDVRILDQRQDFVANFDIAICFENIEHILDDRKLMRDIAACLKPSGRLLLTTPNYNYKPITASDNGPFSIIEDGGHVRKGYTEGELIQLCKESGLIFDACSFCSGFVSQKVTFLIRTISKVHPLLGWGLTFPLRIFPPLLDPLVTAMNNWPSYSICLEAHKP